MKKLLSIFLAFICIISQNAYFRKDSIVNIRQMNQINGSSQEEISEQSIYFPSHMIMTEIDSYASYYFKNLNDNYGVNKHASCGYIALAMLLSFWDNFWDDNLIDNKYETSTSVRNQDIFNSESPGTIREEVSGDSNTTARQYYDIVNNYQNDYFHYKMIKVGDELSYINLNNSAPYGMYPSYYSPVLERYLTSRGYTTNQYEIVTNNSDSETIRNTAISYITMGIPVLMGVEKQEGGFHAVIAYDYSVSEDNIFGHSGDYRDQSTTHDNIDQTYKSYQHMVALIPKYSNWEHVCSDAYYSGEGEDMDYFCSCDDTRHIKNGITVNYCNLEFGDQTAELYNNFNIRINETANLMPGNGIVLLFISAKINSITPNSPHLIFLGWYLDMGFNLRLSFIQNYISRSINVYAKWRCDYNYNNRSGDYTISLENGDGCDIDYYDISPTGLGFDNFYDKLKSLGIKKLAFNFKIAIREISDGYQHIYIANSRPQTNDDGTVIMDNILWSVTDIEHGAGVKRTSTGYYTHTVFIDIDDIKDTPSLFVLYGASGNGDDSWVTSKISMSVMFVANEGDDTATPFTWSLDSYWEVDGVVPTFTELKDVSDSL